MSYDYIFCPLCGSVKWQTDKTGYADKGRLEEHKCTSCQNFVYVNHITHETTENGLKVFYKKSYSIKAYIGEYTINVSHFNNWTEILDADAFTVILHLDKALTFNWYSDEAVVEKIKKYLVFS